MFVEIFSTIFYKTCWDTVKLPFVYGPNRVPMLVFSSYSPPLFQCCQYWMLWKQSWVNCKPHKTTLNRGREGLDLHALKSRHRWKLCNIGLSRQVLSKIVAMISYQKSTTSLCEFGCMPDHWINVISRLKVMFIYGL